MNVWQRIVGALSGLGALLALGSFLRVLRARRLDAREEETDAAFRERVVREFAFEPGIGNLGTLERRLQAVLATSVPVATEVQFVTERLPLTPGTIRVVLQVPR